MKQLHVKRFSTDALLPTRAHTTDAGLDVYSPIDINIPHGDKVKINLHIGIALAPGTVGLLQDRSSMGSKGIRVLGGVIDANYRGEIQVVLANVAGESEHIILRGEKIAQLIIVPVYTPEIIEVNDLDITDRNDKGFGSTGR